MLLNYQPSPNTVISNFQSIEHSFIATGFFQSFHLYSFISGFLIPGYTPKYMNFGKRIVKSNTELSFHVYMSLQVLYYTRRSCVHHTIYHLIKARLFVLVARQADPKIVCIFCHIMKYNIRLHMVDIHG